MLPFCNCIIIIKLTNATVKPFLFLLLTLLHMHKSGVLHLFYSNFIVLCNKKGVTPSSVVEQLGFKRSVVTRWKKGSHPHRANAQKVADYFGVTVEQLMGNELPELPPKEPKKSAPSDYSKDAVKEMLKSMDLQQVLEVISLASERARELGDIK